jgi:hypothetical protein
MKEREKLKRKLKAILGVKGSLCLLSLAIVVLALVAYTAQVTITPTKQFNIGATTASWTVYINDVDEVRYLPSSGTPAGSNPPVGSPVGDPTKYAFNVTTDAGGACSVKIELTSAVDSSRFSKFEIRVKWWNATAVAWQDVTLYDAATGGSVKAFINGTLAGDTGYIQHAASTTRCYLIWVTYSYDLVDTTTDVTVTFRYTPLPQ